MEDLFEMISERPVLFARYACYIGVAVAGLIAALIKKRKDK